jgi:hypothetical protein
MRARVFTLIILVSLAASAAFAWRNFAGEYNSATGWPGVRMTDENGHVVCAVAFTTPGSSFSVPYITLMESMEPNDIAGWNTYYPESQPLVAKRLQGATPGLNVSKVKIFDYLTPEAWEACGGNSAFINHQPQLIVGYMKGDKWKSIVIDDYEVDPAMMGITFELKPIKEATPMGPICWGYWVSTSK